MEENKIVEVGRKSMFSLDNLPSFLITLLVFLIPIFFIPSLNVSVQTSKSILVFSLVIVSFCLFLVSVLRKGKFEFPVSKTYIAVAVVPVAILISALFSKVPSMSLMGYGSETGTFGFIFLMCMFLFLVLTLFQSEKKIFYSYIAFFTTASIISLFHIVRLFFGPNALSLGLFTSPTSNTVGGWYDLAIFFGAILVLSIVSIEMLTMNRLLKIFSRTLLVVAFCFLVVINFYLLWIVLAVLALLFFVYLFSFEQISNDNVKQIGADGEVVHIAKRDSNVRKISVVTLIVLIVSCLFLTPLVSSVGNSISAMFNLSSLEARPSWGATIDISKNVLKKDAFWGAGPNRFASEWQLFKPAEINLTPFWDMEFSTTIGFIPTFLTTTGVIGFASWMLFLALFLYTGFVSLFAKGENSFLRYLTASSFFTALYLWIMLVVYTPSMSIIVLAFFFTGLFFASLHREKIFKSKSFAFSSYPRASFAMVLSLVLVMVGTLWFGYVFAEKTLSAYYFGQSIASLSRDNNVDASENYALRAIKLWGNDAYYRGLSDLQIVRLNNIVASVTGTQVSDEVKNEFQRVLGNAVDSASLAVQFDSANYQNWTALARVYQAITPLGVEQAYESAQKAYGEAIAQSPQNPTLNLMLARLETGRKDFAKAKEYIARALAQKGNYSEAIFLRSQIEVAEGNTKAAISSVEGIALISPNDAGVLFELGLLKYNNKDFSGAARAFEGAVKIIPQYSNAKYFLGLSYEKLGKRTDALLQFEDIAKLNPDNAEISLIVKNLHEGRSSFTNAEPPVDDKPEKRSKLPVDEEEN